MLHISPRVYSSQDMTPRLFLLLPLLLLHASPAAAIMPLRRFRPAPISDPQPLANKLGGPGALSEESDPNSEDFESYTNSFEVTRPLTAPPGSSECVVDIMTNHLFADNPPPFVANYIPPTDCGKVRWSLEPLFHKICAPLKPFCTNSLT